MKRNITCYLACLCLIIALALPFPVAMADLRTLDIPLLPEDTVAVVISPPNNDQPRIIYAIHGITKDDETLSVNVMQLSKDSQWKIYDADTAGVSEQEIRWVHGYPKDQPIVGSYCEGYIGKESDDPREQWVCYKQDGSIPCGNNMDEQFTFLLSEIEDGDEKIIFQMDYNCIPVPGAIYDTPHCLMTIDVSDYLK